MFSRVICPGIFIAFLLYTCYYNTWSEHPK
nr:MAG TPA: Gamma-aminobutyric acid receptor subunit beta-3 gated ion channel Cys-Loop [Caudoviricetes sp.]